MFLNPFLEVEQGHQKHQVNYHLTEDFDSFNNLLLEFTHLGNCLTLAHHALDLNLVLMEFAKIHLYLVTRIKESIKMLHSPHTQINHKLQSQQNDDQKR